MIADCGELGPGDDGIQPVDDGTGDVYPDFPVDSGVSLSDVSILCWKSNIDRLDGTRSNVAFFNAEVQCILNCVGCNCLFFVRILYTAGGHVGGCYNRCYVYRCTMIYTCGRMLE